jgi:hypothetical protein
MLPDEISEAEDEEFDEWEEFRYEDQDPISISELNVLDLSKMPEDVHIPVMDDYFPEASISRSGNQLICNIQDHMYTKFWEHKFSAYAFAEAMERAIRRLTDEGHPFANPERDDEDVHIFVKWDLILPRDTPSSVVAESINAAHDLVCERASAILENSDSVLILGKDTGESLELLKRIADRLQQRGYFTHIIKEQPDKLGESVIQKVMRYALIGKFVIVENTQPSGHLYEIPHVSKAAECVTVMLQEAGKGATWMFEDAYAKHDHIHKIEYLPPDLNAAVDAAADWAESFIKHFGVVQTKVLPWMTPKP